MLSSKDLLDKIQYVAESINSATEKFISDSKLERHFTRTVSTAELLNSNKTLYDSKLLKVKCGESPVLGQIIQDDLGYIYVYIGGNQWVTQDLK